MNNGALCVKRLLTDRNFVITDEKAHALWNEIKAYWRQRDEEDPMRPTDIPAGFAIEEFTCEPLIDEIEESALGLLDTFPRGSLLDGIAEVTSGASWPVSGDPESIKKAAFKAIVSGLSDRGIERTKTLR